MGMNISIGKGSGIVGKLIATGFGLFFAFIGFLFVKSEWKNLQETKAMQEWERTTCTIVSCESEDAGENFRLLLAYRYTVAEKSYTAERYENRNHFYTAETIGEIKRMESRLAAGTTTEAYYDPSNPAEAVLVLPTVKGAMSSIGLTLIFPTFGLFFATLPWIAGRKRGSTKKPAQVGERSSKVFLIIFGLFFAVLSGLMIKPLLVTPLQQTRDAQNWQAVPAVVESSKVRSHSDDDGTTYSVYIAYCYEIHGKKHYGDRYTFMGGSSSGYDSKAEIVRQHPQGSEINVYVNPSDPSESVIRRDYSKSLLFGLIPLVFFMIGIAVMIAGFRSKKPSLDMSQSQEHVVALQNPSRIGKAVGIIMFTVIWNGIVYFMFSSGEVPLWFASIFGIAGVIMIGASTYSILAIFNPKPTVEITPGNIQPGTNVAMRWRIGGRTDRIVSLSIKFQCLKVTTETTGSGKNRSSRVVRTPLHETELLQTQGQSEIAQGTLQFEIPEDQPASRSGNTSGIQWQLVFHGDIARWPDMKTELPFIVYPDD